MNVVLIGFKSCGKSTVGRLLAPRLGLAFRDLDDVLEELLAAETGRPWTCRQYYLDNGGDAFRAAESRALASLTGADGLVLATGGGAPLAPENRRRLGQIGTVVYIQAVPETLWPRLEADGWPAWLRDDPRPERLREIWAERHPGYQAAADLVVEVAEQPPEAIADEIVNRLSQEND